MANPKGGFAMTPRYRVTLTVEERQKLETLTKTAKTNARRFLYARSLLLCDAGAQGLVWTVADTAEAMGVTLANAKVLQHRAVKKAAELGMES